MGTLGRKGIKLKSPVLIKIIEAHWNLGIPITKMQFMSKKKQRINLYLWLEKKAKVF